ncbi:MAG: HlyD family secretion protein [Neisseriales bacterium]|nr:MAG: HlyD family secretion protein [Neisseriales bacterium]
MNFHVIKRLNNFPFLVFALIVIAGVIYFFSYLFPFTNNAFVVANISPVAADVSGFITDIYVKNGQIVKKGTPLFKVYDAPYEQSYNQARALYLEAEANIEVIQKQTQKNLDLLHEAQENYDKANYEYGLKTNQLVIKAVPKLDVEKLNYDRRALANKVLALRNQLAIDDSQIKQQRQKVLALKAAMNLAKINLDLTIVKAFSDGIVDNLYLSVGTPIIQHQPLFSFIDTNSLYIQANFNEIDLRDVYPGDEVFIFPRMYLWSKVYHGIVVGKTWSTNRQITNTKSQMQTVTENENNWVMLPQRLPLQIKITDYDDEHYPLSVGSSAYVYIQTQHQ